MDEATPPQLVKAPPPVAEPPIPVEVDADEPVRIERRLLDLKTIVSFAIGFALLAFMFTRVEIRFEEVWSALTAANPWLVLAGFLSYYAGFPIRGLRWRRMLRDAHATDDTGGALPSPLRLGAIVFMSWFANSVVPFKLGDIFRAYLLKADHGIRGAKGMGTILAERLLDLGCLLTLLAIAGYIGFRERLPAEVLLALQFGFGLVIVGVVGLFVLYRWSHLLVRLLPERIQGLYARFHTGITLSLRSPGYLLPLTLLAWLSEIGRLTFVTWSLGVHPPGALGGELAMIAFIALASAAMTAVPATPGGLGLVEFLIVKAFMWTALTGSSNITEPLALAVAIVDRAISYISVIALGFVCYIITRRR